MISAVHVGGKKAEILSLPPVPWMQQGACRGIDDPDKFFRERAEKQSGTSLGKTRASNTKDAKVVCGRCAVSSDCLLWALEYNEEYGVWGGSTPEERQVMKRYM